jgi:hypothetical protein
METSVVITCSECSKRFKGKASLAGKKIKCPFCKEAFVVPADVAGDAAPLAFQKEEPKKRIVFEDEDEPGAYAVTTLDLSPRCPNCANPMADNKAFICLYCGYNTLTRSWGKTEKLLGHTAGDYFAHQMVAHICAGITFILVLMLVFLDLVFPYVLVPNTWQVYLDHESMRLWITIIMLFIFFSMGTLFFKRFIVNPTPPEKRKE